MRGVRVAAAGNDRPVSRPALQALHGVGRGVRRGAPPGRRRTRTGGEGKMFRSHGGHATTASHTTAGPNVRPCEGKHRRRGWVRHGGRGQAAAHAAARWSRTTVTATGQRCSADFGTRTLCSWSGNLPGALQHSSSPLWEVPVSQKSPIPDWETGASHPRRTERLLLREGPRPSGQGDRKTISFLITHSDEHGRPAVRTSPRWCLARAALSCDRPGLHRGGGPAAIVDFCSGAAAHMSLHVLTSLGPRRS